MKRLFVLVCGVLGTSALLSAPLPTCALAFETQEVDAAPGGDSAPFVDPDQLNLVNSLNKGLQEDDATADGSSGLSLGNFHVGAAAYGSGLGDGYGGGIGAAYGGASSLPTPPQLTPDQPGWIFTVPH